jgi:hypothetical protein
MVKRLKGLYDTLDEATTPASVLLPWFPSPSMVKKLAATKKIYDIVDEVLNARIQGGVYRKDTLQMLLDNGDERLVCIGVSPTPSRSPNLILVLCVVYHGALNCRCKGFWYSWQVHFFLSSVQ